MSNSYEFTQTLSKNPEGKLLTRRDSVRIAVIVPAGISYLKDLFCKQRITLTV